MGKSHRAVRMLTSPIESFPLQVVFGRKKIFVFIYNIIDGYVESPMHLWIMFEEEIQMLANVLTDIQMIGKCINL